MNALSDYMDDLKKLKGLDTDVELAAYLGIEKQRINRARKEGYLTDEQCAVIANELGKHPALVMIARESIKDKNAAYRWAWEEAFAAGKKVLGTVAIASVLSVNQFTPIQSQVYDFSMFSSNKDYRKLRSLFSFKRLALVLSEILGTASRLLPRQPIPIFR